jgi:hypothetical protein
LQYRRQRIAVRIRHFNTERTDYQQEASMSQPTDFEPEEPIQPQPEDESLSGQAAQYEFNAHQNSIIRAMAVKMKYVGFIYVFAGGLMAAVSVVAMFMKPWFGLFYLCVFAPQLLIGIWNIHAANSFGFVVTTAGNDIQHLMSAIVSLRKLYTLNFWVMSLLLTLVVVGIAAGVFFWSSGSIHITIK